jgi:hypothetical protein
LIGAYGTLVALVAASVVVGLAVLSLCGRREPSWQAAPVGLAALLVTAGIVTGLADGASPIAIALVALVAASLAVLLVGHRRDIPARWASSGAPVALLTALAASLPFIAAGRVGVLGVGLVNDDMASHLLMAAWIDDTFSPEPVLIDQGYPLGPHALAAGTAELLGTGLVEAFAGLTLALPVLIALLAFGALDRLGPVWRVLAATATAVPYLLAAYLAQEAFKEPVMALFVLATALWLPRVEGWRDGVPLGVLAAGTVYVYSFPGLAWIAGTVVVWAAIEIARRPQLRRALGAAGRRAAPPVAAALATGLVLVALDLDRVGEFADFRALDPDRANESGLGNLRGHISPLVALGVWPTSEFRLSAGAGSLPAIAFYAGAALGLLALAIGTPRWVRAHGWAIPAALIAAAAVYIGARGLGTVYTSAKALAVATPLIMLMALGGLLGGRGDIRPDSPSSPAAVHAPPTSDKVRWSGHRLAFASAFATLAALSSFLVLRQAPVGPEEHGEELAEIRPEVQGEKLLFLGRDNFVLYSLRGSKPFTHVRNFYDPYFVTPNFELEQVASKFDFDSVTAETLAKFPYVVTTRAAYASGPPLGYDAIVETDSYALWEAGGDPEGRVPAETGPEPTGALRCRGRQRFARGAAAPADSVVAAAANWSPDATIEDGSPASIQLELPAGSWHLSLQYDATRPVTLSGQGLDETIPGNLDYRGVAPFWPAGAIRLDEPSTVEVEASVEEPPLAGRLMGADSVAHLGAIAATRAWGGYAAATPPSPGAGERLGRIRCGQEADWTR